jgi:hypothetical protein
VRFETSYRLAEDDFTGPTTRFVRAVPDPALLPTMPLEQWEALKARLHAMRDAVPNESGSLVVGLVVAILVTVLACIAVSAV